MLCAAACASNAPEALAQAADAGWILQKLARPAPTSTDFVELRDSKLLKQPLRLSGVYSRPDADTLVREVRAPYAETTTIRAGEATIARAGKSPRRFSLSRAPELAGLQASFGALLSGDRAALEKFYRVAAQGTRQQWTMTLAPKDAALAAKVRDVALYGRGAELRCIETHAANGGETQRTLLAGAARAAQAATASDALQVLCRGDAK
ncbi:fatty acyl CoA synthetase [Luteimonas gilva]|uniref:Fatty acyl CoA synthetase n=1 Tax=Luteimonas gilva TaxID=2572684 RepID=A0A4U5JMF8_9GAMM|nr:LolA-related protein [Luteimonas gilva]TKR30365.1 fatty acyl CoA synthetase [Luteimonas gilva]